MPFALGSLVHATSVIWIGGHPSHADTITRLSTIPVSAPLSEGWVALRLFWGTGALRPCGL